MISLVEGSKKELEHTSTQNLRDLKCYYRLSSEENSSKCNDEDEASHHSVAIAKAFRHPTVKEQPDDFATVGSVAQPSLPWSRNLIGAVGEPDTIFLVELGKAV